MESDLKLENLVYSPDAFHFRLYTVGQIIDLETEDSVTFNCTVTSFAYRQITKRKVTKTRTISAKMQLDTAVAKQLFQLTKTIASISSGTMISGWGKDSNGVAFETVHGYGYTLELSARNSYSVKIYNNPGSQSKKIPEAQQIDQFANEVYKLLALDDIYSDFTNTLDPGYYSNGTVREFIVLPDAKKRQRFRAHWE